MPYQEVSIRFAELRRLASSVPSFLAGRVGADSIPTLRAELENEFGLAGLDTEELITEFADTFHVNVTMFDFTGLIGPEGLDLLDTIWFFPIVTYLLLGWLLKTVASLLCWPFNHRLARRIWQQQVPPFWRSCNTPPQLTIGDFVASAAAGQFVRRHQVHFRLVR